MGISSFISAFAGAFSISTKRALPAYSFLESGEGNVVIAKDGSVGSMIRIDGTKRMMGDKELQALVADATTRMSSYFGRPGYAVQVWFCRDPDLSKQLLKGMMVAPRTVSKRLGMELDDVFAERERILPDYIVYESFYMVLWTRLSILSKKELDAIKTETKTPPLWPKAMDTQNPFRAARQMIARHKAFVGSFVENLRIFGIRNEVLDAHEALKVTKASIYPDMTDANWKPYLPGDMGKDLEGKPNIPFPRRPQVSGDYSHLLWPRLDDQLFDREAEIINAHVVRVGRHLFSSVDMTMGPQDLLPFSSLLDSMSQDEFPWRVSFLLEGDGIGSYSLRSFLAAIATFSNTSENNAIRSALKALSEYRKDGAVPRMRVSFATWAPAGKMALIEERVNRLQRSVENWGYCHVSSNPGDPLAGVFSSACGLDVASTAPPGLPPLNNALALLPWNRDASPFSKGSVLFRTRDGRPWPFEPGSDLQSAHISIVYAPPGMGKSVLLNTLSLAFCLSPKGTSGVGGAKLPRIAIIDIGRSSSGMISLIKESLPAARRHEAEFRRLRNTAEFAINPLDTQLGCRKPLPHERAFLVNFITLLATDSNQGKADRGMSDMAAKAIEEMYESMSDLSKRGEPKRYVGQVDEVVDEALKRYNVNLSKSASWWECTDRLFELGAFREAALAQRYAVPLIEDLLQAVNSPQITDIYGEATVEGGERLIKAFQRVISGCISEYKILTVPTRFDLGEARVVALDLDEVAPRGTGPAEKQTAMVYMLARFALAKDFYLTVENVRDMPDLYKSHHEKRIRRISETPKLIIFDEFHRTKGSQMVRDQVKIDMREGRKWGVQISLASQLIEDFDDDMVSLSSGFFIMGAPQERDISLARQKFGLSESATSALTSYLNGPSAGGAPFLAVLQMKDGRHEHLLYNKLGPMELWAYSTTPEDVGLRDRLYSICGAAEGRLRLAKCFPQGSAKKEIDRRIREMAERGEVIMSEASESIIDQIATECIARRMD